jgi:SAM-dependent methyltransferase
MLNRRHEYQRMAQVECDLWWYRVLHRLVADALASHPRGRDARLMDAGCGTGGLLQFLRQRGYRHLSGFDLSRDAVLICRERGLAVEQRDLRELDQAVESERAEAIVSNDTLYFFTPEEQSNIIRLCWKALVPGGLLILNLPALSAFRGIHDLSVGIQYRFSKSDVPRLLSPTYFDLVQARFWPFFLSPIIYAVRLSQRVRMRRRPDFKMESDLSLPPSWLNQLFSGVTQLENALLPWKPFGSSLFLVGRKIQR